MKSTCCNAEVRFRLATMIVDVPQPYCSKCDNNCTVKQPTPEIKNVPSFASASAAIAYHAEALNINQPTPDWQELMEKLADIEHERWADWQEYIMDCAVKSGDDLIGVRTFGWDTKKVLHWEHQIEASYSELSEEDKEKDREQVRRYLPLVEDFITSEKSKSFKEGQQSILEKVEKELVDIQKDYGIPEENSPEIYGSQRIIAYSNGVHTTIDKLEAIIAKLKSEIK